MNKDEHGERLRAAMAQRGHSRETVAQATGRGVRTVTNWTTGERMPNDTDRETLRRLYPGYDTPGDPVVVAIEHSGLDDWRKDVVKGEYRRHLAEQRGRGATA